MSKHKSRFWIVLVLVCLLVTPATLEAQCAVTMTAMTTFTFGTMLVTKTLSMAGNCVTTSSNAFGCGRSPSAMAANMLIASRLPATMNPFCNWVCNCGTGFPSEMITTGTADGLPVELMDFSVEG